VSVAVSQGAGTVTRKPATWLHDQHYIDDEQRDVALDRGSDAARDLPRAEKLAKLLYGQSRRTPPFDPEALPDDGYVEDQLTIERVEPGWPHFNGGLFATGRFGPVKVSPKASELTRVGWRVTITLARIRGAWTIVEVGNVYPD